MQELLTQYRFYIDGPIDSQGVFLVCLLVPLFLLLINFILLEFGYKEMAAHGAGSCQTPIDFDVSYTGDWQNQAQLLCPAAPSIKV